MKVHYSISVLDTNSLSADLVVAAMYTGNLLCSRAEVHDLVCFGVLVPLIDARLRTSWQPRSAMRKCPWVLQRPLRSLTSFLPHFLREPGLPRALNLDHRNLRTKSRPTNGAIRCCRVAYNPTSPPLLNQPQPVSPKHTDTHTTAGQIGVRKEPIRRCLLIPLLLI